MFVKPEQIFEATNGGLDVILAWYPQASESAQNQTLKFRIRPIEKDRTKSASLKQIAGGIWVVTDFGDDQKPRNCIEVVRREENCDFKQAINIIATRFNIIPPEEQRVINKAEVTKRDATEEETDGNYYFDKKKEFTEADLKTLFSKGVVEFFQSAHKDKWIVKLSEVCTKLNFFAINSFTQIKERKAIVTTATPTFHLFIIEGETFTKIYQPNNLDKQYRFRYSGTRPKDYIFGYKHLIKQYNDLISQSDEGEADQLDHVMICSGDRDSLNAAALGYTVIWQNSETAKLTKETVGQLRKMCKNIYNVPDIDTTGYKQGHELAMIWLDVKTVWLPSSLSDHKDFRGNPCKDLRDFLNLNTKKQFDDLVKVALAYQFWIEEPKFKRNGEFKGYHYHVNNTRLYNFLSKNGFWRHKNESNKDGYIYIQVIENIVKEISPNDIKAYINSFLESRKQSEELRNSFFKSNQLGESSFSNLKEKEIDFTDYEKHSQFIFFINKTWKITKEGITEFKPSDVSKFVWDNELIKHRVKLLEKPFTVTKKLNPDGTEEFDIEIHDKNCLFLKYLSNTSRMFWRKEYEEGWQENEEKERLKYIEDNKFNIAGKRLTDLEIQEQKHHLINKLYSLGYLLHRYKNPSRPWCVFSMDNKVSDDGGSHGGSGKSIAYKCLKYFMNNIYFDGRNKRLTDNPHIYENVTEHTDYVIIDDADEYVNFNFFFAPITGDLAVNPKNNKQFVLPFEKTPKFAITSNYTLRNLDPSTVRRLLYTVFGDYYHHNKDNEYRENRSPEDDFGKNLFTDFTEEEWNSFFNTMAYACSLYLNFDKIEPPLGNVEKRTLQTEMGEAFRQWADVYFSYDNKKLDEMVVKKEAFEDFKEASNQKIWTSQKFGRALKAWCKYNHYELDPAELKNSQGRISRQVIRRVSSKDGSSVEKEITTEMIYIKTKTEINKTSFDTQSSQMKIDESNTDIVSGGTDLPY